MNIRRPPLPSCALGLGLGLCMALAPAARAQWSIGAPEARREEAAGPAARDRYVYFVLANPVPGQEVAFNDWYQNVHMGDLVQLPGWTGAQRFRLVGDVNPRPTQDGYRYGYMIAWDQEGDGAPPSREALTPGFAGGKIRRGKAFDYVTPGASLGATYRLLGPKARRPDGKGPFMPAADDNTHARPNRYLLLEFSDPAPGVSQEAFRAALDLREREVLSLPGWMAAQRMLYVPTRQPSYVLQVQPAAVKMPATPQYLTVWEYEGPSAQAANQELAAAERSGKAHPLPRDPATAVSTYWEPISPWIGKAAFDR